MSGDYAIESHGLTRRFGAFTAVDHIDLRIPRAQIYGFLGPNGSGKSTTIRMLCGLLTPSEGEARVLGHPVPGDADALKQQIGYMTQRFSLYEDLDVQENLDFIADIYCLPRKTRRARIEAQLERYNLIEQRRQRAGTLSGGQKQRLALADGTPTQLYADMDARVVEVETDAPGPARAALGGLAPILSVTQLGVRLRVLVARAVEDAPALVRSALVSAGVEARVQPVHPSLEDVFVLATDSDGAES